MAITFDAASSNIKEFNANSNTISVTTHTVATGSNLFLLASVGYYTAGNTVSGVTWNGVALTQVSSAAVATSNNHQTDLWYLVNPATGNNTLTVTMTNNDSLLFAGVSSWQGVDQTTPIGTAATNTGASVTAASVTVSSATGEMVAGSVVHEASSAAQYSTSDTEMYEQFSTTGNVHSGAYTSGAASAVLNWTSNLARNFAANGINIKPAAGGTTVTPGVASLTTTGFAPTVTVSDNKTATPGVLSQSLSTFAPVVSVTDNQLVVPDTATLSLTRFAPTIVGGEVVNVPVTRAGVSRKFRRIIVIDDVEDLEEELKQEEVKVEKVRKKLKILQKKQVSKQGIYKDFEPQIHDVEAVLDNRLQRIVELQLMISEALDRSILEDDEEVLLLS